MLLLVCAVVHPSLAALVHLWLLLLQTAYCSSQRSWERDCYGMAWDLW